MKCFCHLKNHAEQVPDDPGNGVRSSEQAYAQAMKVIQELLDEEEPDPKWKG